MGENVSTVCRFLLTHTGDTLIFSVFRSSTHRFMARKRPTDTDRCPPKVLRTTTHTTPIRVRGLCCSSTHQSLESHAAQTYGLRSNFGFWNIKLTYTSRGGEETHYSQYVLSRIVPGSKLFTLNPKPDLKINTNANNLYPIRSFRPDECGIEIL